MEAHAINTRSFSIATFNTLGVPFFSSHPTARFQALCQIFERLAPDLINLQEVHVYNLLAILKKQLPSYPFIAYERGLLGPRGGLVTLSRSPLARAQFHASPSELPPAKNRFLRTLAGIQKGTLITSLANWPLLVYNTHLLANTDGDWSSNN